MLVVGTKPEYFNAVWVKNEWSRYLKLLKKDRKKLLIPCYRDMDPYTLPDEFAHLQSQDMSRIGFIQDLIRGIKKVIPTAPKNHVTKNVILLVVSIAIWIFGVVVGFPNPTLSTCALCICIYLFVRAIAAFWRYRGF